VCLEHASLCGVVVLLTQLSKHCLYIDLGDLEVVVDTRDAIMILHLIFFGYVFGESHCEATSKYMHGPFQEPMPRPHVVSLSRAPLWGCS